MGISTTRRRSQLCCLQLYVWIHSSFRYIISKQRGILDQVQGRDGRHNIVEEIRQGWSGTTARGVGLSPPATFLTDSIRLLHGNLCHSKQPRQSTGVICAIDSNDAPCHVDSLSVSVSIKGSHTRFDTRIASLAASALLVVLFVCRCVGDTISGSSSNGGSCSGSCSSSGWFGWGLR